MKPNFALSILAPLFAAASPVAAAPVNTNVEACDVSPTGVRIVWHTDIAAEPTVQVYTNAAGTIAAAGAVVVAYAGLDDFTKLLLSDAGLMSVGITGLAPDTVYYFRAGARSLADSSTSTAPLLVSARTATGNGAVSAAAPFLPVSNPVVRFTCLTPDGNYDADTGIVVARIAGARTPLSVPLANEGTVYIDTANLISNATGLTLATSGGESLVLDFYRGRGTVERLQFYMPASDGLGTVQDPRLVPGPLTATQVRAVKGTSGVARVFMEFPAVAGGYYHVESSPTLANGTWTVAEVGLLATDSRIFWEDHGLSGTPVPPSATPRRFYRLVPFAP